MVEIKIEYQGQLHCQATHGPSGAVLGTDAPVDNMGRGEAFSPTDLVATALGACMMTVMGIVAQRHEINLTGSTVRVVKEMVTTPPRRIGRLSVEIHIPCELPEEDRRRFEHAAAVCPVHKSLHPDIEVPVRFFWGDKKC